MALMRDSTYFDKAHPYRMSARNRCLYSMLKGVIPRDPHCRLVISYMTKFEGHECLEQWGRLDVYIILRPPALTYLDLAAAIADFLA